MDLTLHSPLTALPGVGQARAQALAKLGLAAVGDLLAYFPREYEDRTLQESIAALPPRELARFRRERLGFVFQDFNLLDTLTLEENIGLALSLNNTDPETVQRRVREMAARLEIMDVLEKFPYQVSGGQKQRAACARAMVAGQSLLLADEPTGALDSKASKNLLEIMTRMNRDMGATILMVTHDAYSASYAARVLFLKDGRLFHELLRGERGRPVFYHEVLDVLALLGGDVSDVI